MVDRGAARRRLKKIVQKVQEYFRKFIPANISLVDELIAERREKAAHESKSDVLENALKSLQVYFQELAPADLKMSDELISERQEEAKRE